MTMYVALFLVVVVLTPFVLSQSEGGPTPMTSRWSPSSERDHIGHHMQEVPDIHQMAEEELRFLYFQMHDSDHNNRLDGCELVNSLLHWHVEEHKAAPHSHSQGTSRVFGHEELAYMIDPILTSDDKNLDGFIDYPEFVAAQVSRGF